MQHSVQDCVLQAIARPALLDTIIGTEAAGAQQRVDVYVNAYRARLLEVLGNDFPGLRAWVGAEAFEQMGLASVEATPSSFANVRWYGSALAGFLETTAPWCEQPALGELAALEWNMGLAFDAATQPVVDVATMAAVAAQDWPAMCLRLHGSLHRQSLAWNVAEIRRAFDQDQPAPHADRCEPAQPWVVWRKDSGVHYRRLDNDETAALDAIEHGASFAKVCEVLCEYHTVDAVAARTAGLFRRWIDDQWITALQPESDVPGELSA